LVDHCARPGATPRLTAACLVLSPLCDSGSVVDSNWLAVNELVLNGLRDAYVLEDPPKSDADLVEVSKTVTDHVVAAVELSRSQKRSARERWRIAGRPR